MVAPKAELGHCLGYKLDSWTGLRSLLYSSISCCVRIWDIGRIQGGRLSANIIVGLLSVMG